MVHGLRRAFGVTPKRCWFTPSPTPMAFSDIIALWFPVNACVRACVRERTCVCVYVHVRASSGLCWPSTPLRFMHDPTPHHLNLVNSSSNSCFIHVLIYIFVYWYLVNDRSACIHVCNLTKIWTENSTMGGYWGNLCKLNIQVKLKNYWPMGDLECILYPQKWLSGLISMVLIEKIP